MDPTRSATKPVPLYDRTNIPEAVARRTLDPELEAWLPSGPTLGADIPIAQGHRDHVILGKGRWPEIGAVETLVLPNAGLGLLGVRPRVCRNPTRGRSVQPDRCGSFEYLSVQSLTAAFPRVVVALRLAAPSGCDGNVRPAREHFPTACSISRPSQSRGPPPSSIRPPTWAPSLRPRCRSFKGSRIAGLSAAARCSRAAACGL